MKIGVNCINLVDKIGGLKVYFNNLFDFLLENDTTNEYTFFFTEANLRFLSALKSNRWNDRGIRVTRPSEILKHVKKLDLYFCPVGILEPRPVPIPSVYTLADIQDSFLPQFFSRRSLLARRIHYKNSVTMADRVITISDFSRDALIERYGVDPRKVVRIYLNAESDFYADYGRAGPPRPDGIPRRYVFYPANRWKHKNHRTLLETIRILNEQYRDDVSLVLTGDDPRDGFDVLAESRRLGIGDRVISLGFVDKQNLISLYRNAVCLCYPSLFEGFGIPLVEAMAVGCPVICSNTTSIPEVVGDAALQVEPLDSRGFAAAIHAVITDSNVREDLARKGRQQARLFSPGNTSREHLRVFEEASGGFSRKRYFYCRLPFVDPVYKSMRLISWLRGRFERVGTVKPGLPPDGPGPDRS
jgi:glycosyltransferase involved in cell wall biosynthesis